MILRFSLEELCGNREPRDVAVLKYKFQNLDDVKARLDTPDTANPHAQRAKCDLIGAVDDLLVKMAAAAERSGEGSEKGAIKDAFIQQHGNWTKDREHSIVAVRILLPRHMSQLLDEHTGGGGCIELPSGDGSTMLLEVGWERRHCRPRTNLAMPPSAPTWDGKAYAAHRPTYPAHLYDAICEFAGAQAPRELAVDVGCGSGQVCVSLAGRFDRVVGLDASQSQLDNAAAAPSVDYRLGSAEHTGLAPASVDLLTAAAALHWFHRDAFYAEARRVLKPGGALAAWSYNAAATRAKPQRGSRLVSGVCGVWGC